MKKILLYTFISAISLCLITGCSEDFLDTKPTDKGSGDGLFDNAKAALTPLNGIYRLMYTQGWSVSGNTQQTDGVSAYALMGDLMGEDMVMKAMGSGWYWYDCTYDVKDSYRSKNWRSWDLWNAYYTLISNANYIIAAETTMGGTTEEINYVVGQAYAIRAYCYHYLAMSFCRTYKGHESDPGVPVYTEPTTPTTVGKPRGTLQDVYTQIKSDIDKAVTMLKDAPKQTDKTHIDYYVANGFKARICLTMNLWDEAATAANIARSTTSKYVLGTKDDISKGMNDVKLNNVMWGATIIATHTQGWGPFYFHMDALSMLPGDQTYAYRAPKCISIPLYQKMGSKDTRRVWWQPDNNQIKNSDGVAISNYIQVKFRFSDPKQLLGDKIWMRVEEMYLTEAEALCRQGKDGDARQVLMDYMKTRDADYTTTKSGFALGALTTDETGSLLEEILIQRRIELWGEYGRIYDIKRLKQGFMRTSAMGWTADGLIPGVLTTDPESYAWVLTIPQAEFDANPSLNQTTDQNPLGDTK